MTNASPQTVTGRRTAIRWRVCALLLISTTIVYLNRSAMGVLKPTLEKQLHFGEAEYGWLQFSFTTAYTLMFVFAGRFVDWVGAKLSLAVGVIFWSLATAACGLCATWQALAGMQFLLGCGASLNFPASFKAVAEWFPQKERALAAGIFNSGSNMGIIAAVIAAWAAVHYGWPWGFYIVGATGILWLILWIPAKAAFHGLPPSVRLLSRRIVTGIVCLGVLASVYATVRWGWDVNEAHSALVSQQDAHPWANAFAGAFELACYAAATLSVTVYLWLLLWIPGYFTVANHPDVNAAEIEYIRAGQPAAPQKIKVPWYALLRYRQTWPFVIGKFLTDPVWWFYSNWLPGYLHDKRGLSLVGSAGALAIPYLAADFGSIFGGWLSGGLIARGFSVGAGRYIAMALCAVGMPGSIIAVYSHHFWLAIALISLATASHQGWSANLFTTATDLFPNSVVGSMVGLGGMAGGVGGMLMTLAVGNSLAQFGSYAPVFIWAGLMHPLAWVLFFLIAGPKMQQAVMDPDIASRLSPNLLLGGSLIGILGGARVTYVLSQWNEYPSHTVAAGALVAGSAILALGLGLIFASLPRRRLAA